MNGHDIDVGTLKEAHPDLEAVVEVEGSKEVQKETHSDLEATVEAKGPKEVPAASPRDKT